MRFQQLAIFGPGLIGGSLALAVRQRGLCGHLTLWSRDPAERDAARRLEVAEVVTDDLAEAARGADLALICTPPAIIPILAREIAPHLPLGAVVSDVASVKAGLSETLTEIFERPDGTGSRYVGSHPMAGSERGGLTGARGDLFEGRVCLLTPLTGRTAPGAADAVTNFWRDLGMRTLCLTPAEHDAAVAQVSHLPHLLSAALASLPEEWALACAGPGWRDMTRLAGGPAELWTEILSLNRLPVTDALRGLMARLGEVLEILETNRAADLENFLKEARSRRGEWSPSPENPAASIGS